MPRQIALLRGVNVGGARKLPMAELRAMFESLGHSDVVTLIQSGNVVFTSKQAVTSGAVEAAIKKRFGLEVAVMLRTPAQLRKVINGNPYPRVQTTTLHVGFLTKKPPARSVASLDLERFLPDEVAIKGSEIYFHLPNGMGRSKLPVALDRQLKIPTTIRNWNTITKLLELA